MRTVLLVSDDETLRARLMRSLNGRSVFAAGTDEEGLRTLRVTEVELIVKEATRPSRDVAAFLSRARQLCPYAVVVCVVPVDRATEDDEALESADYVLLQPFTSRHLQGILRQAEEKLTLVQEVAALRASHRPGGASPVVAQDLARDAGLEDGETQAVSQVVKELAKALSAGFDLQRVVALFLDAVTEMMQPSRSAILISDQAGQHYRVAAHRGLAPHLVESASLHVDTGLPAWLGAEGRPLHIEEAQARPADPAARQITRELALLQSVMAVPLLSHGELVAILTLGRKITGGAFSRRETEMLWSLASHLASAIRDIRVHHLLQYQKEFSERILAHMANGVITIGPDERVVIINRRAEEILGLSARDVLNRDLRALPSPLGDMLFESLSRNRAVNREEIQLALRNLPLEVSTYPVLGEGTAAIGAVVVFEDLTLQRQAHRERREAEQLQLLTRVVARIADEIKNPLVSIRTFMELLEERYDDAAFRHHFAGVVGRDVRRLVQMFEKLAALVDEGDYKLEPVNARAVVEACLQELAGPPAAGAGEDAYLLAFTDESTQKHVAATFSAEGESFTVRADHAMLARAVSYLVWYLLRKTPGQDAKLSVSIARVDKENRVRIIVASRTAEVRAEELQSIFDPIQVVQENLIDVGPCVSQRIVEAFGGQLEARQGRAEVTFAASLPGMPS